MLPATAGAAATSEHGQASPECCADKDAVALALSLHPHTVFFRSMVRSGLSL